jgi:hypothetical protein
MVERNISDRIDTATRNASLTKQEHIQLQNALLLVDTNGNIMYLKGNY